MKTAELVDSDFEDADQDAGVLTAVDKRQQKGLAPVSGHVEYRQQLVSRYHQGSKNLVERLRSNGRDDAEALLLSLINEMVQETDHLLGNELVSTENGELRDASVISFKRAEVLEKAIKAVQAKSQFEKESGIDLDSPMMMIVFRYFMSKVKQTLVRVNAPDDMSDLFFRSLSESMADWKKEMKVQFEELKGKGAK
jgi:hypothetical protein